MESRCPEIQKEEIDDILKDFEGKQFEIIPALQAIQAKYGYVPPVFVKPLAEALRLFPSQVQGVMTFYAQFSMTPRGRNIVRVCRGTACHVRGGRSVLRTANRVLGLGDGETSEDLNFTLETVACLGACALSPVMTINRTYFGLMNPKKAETVLKTI
ncbi:MAG: NAD(P)H-dependent oxidoreductase subunit E [Desulfobacteraceae bacterium]|nr:NAD(P)H-dependent oxidoreductase subunit E [Desulfobacteraceae bacterium]